MWYGLFTGRSFLLPLRCVSEPGPGFLPADGIAARCCQRTFGSGVCVAHEWGHHIQHLRGIFAEHRSQETGEQSDAVRLELQADCYAGVWMHRASQTQDPESGEAFLKEPTSEELAQAWQTAEAIGDDRIQEQAQGTTNPESWTHGSAEQRQRWLETGVQNGSLEKCDTFAAPEV